MYIVKIKNDAIETEIHGITEKLKNGQVVKGINAIDSFSFSILPSNVGFKKLFDLQTLLTVYNTNKNRYEFYGRVLYSSSSMESSGLLSKEVICESYMGFFCDSMQEYVAEKNWTVDGLLSHIVNTHNSQVEPYKRFTIGEVDVEDPNDNLFVGIQRENSWQTLQSKLVEKLGGELRFRVEGDVIYLDYLKKIGNTLSTEIKVSKNMQSVTKECDPSSYITRLIPLGAKLTDAEGNETEERLDITSVNDGKNYIEDTQALSTYGIRYAYVEFDDVTTASNLLRIGQKYLAENNKVQIKYTATALDLSLLGLDINDFDVHNYYPIKNHLLGIEDTARVIKKTIDVCNTHSSTIDLGENFKTLSDLQIESDASIKDAAVQLEKTTKDLKEQISYVEKELTQQNQDIQTSITEQHTELINTCDTIIMEALKSYTETSNFEEFKQTIEAQLQILADNITLQFNSTMSEIDKANGAITELQQFNSTYFTFDINGFTIGKADNPNKVVLANDMITIQVNGVIVQSFDANGRSLIPELKITKSFDEFGFVTDQDNLGNVNCRYVGEQGVNEWRRI